MRAREKSGDPDPELPTPICSADLEAGAASHERSLGDKALMEGDLKLAMKHYNKAVEMNGADHLNWYKRATALMIDKRCLPRVLEI